MIIRKYFAAYNTQENGMGNWQMNPIEFNERVNQLLEELFGDALEYSEF